MGEKQFDTAGGVRVRRNDSPFDPALLDDVTRQVEARRAETSQHVLVEQGAAGYQVDVEITFSRVPNQFDEIITEDGLTS